MENTTIILDDEQRTKLETFVKNGVHSTHLVKRARVILHLDNSNKNRALSVAVVCEKVDLSRQAIYDIRNDYLKAQSIEDFLTRKKRETAPVAAKVDGEVEAKIVALACGEPPKGYSRWTVRLLAEKSIELDFIDSISHMTVKRLLKKRNLSLI